MKINIAYFSFLSYINLEMILLYNFPANEIFMLNKLHNNLQSIKYIKLNRLINTFTGAAHLTAHHCFLIYGGCTRAKLSLVNLSALNCIAIKQTESSLH